jgi:monoamine oxidase
MEQKIPKSDQAENQLQSPEIKVAGNETEVAIIGGGIAGLYCGYLISEANREKNETRAFQIFEETAHLGGRIWSTRIFDDGHFVKEGVVVEEGAVVEGGVQNDENTEGKGKTAPKKEPILEFWAEFGPMRIELDLQHRLKSLLERLSLSDQLDKFPPYESPASEHDPKYELKGEEQEQATPLDLLQLAVARIIGRLVCRYTEEDLLLPNLPGKKHERPARKTADDPGIARLAKQLQRGIDTLSRAVGTRQPDWKIFFVEWIKTLDEPDYQDLRQYGAFDDGTTYADHTKEGTALWNMGFWNLLSEVLSHHAVMKIRDLGTFYHLIPENPSAAEWLIFWLRAFRTREQMVGVRGGMQRITEEISKKIDPKGQNDHDSRIIPNRKLVELDKHGDKIKLRFRTKSGTFEEWHARHVIFAVPRGPLEEIAKANPDVLGRDFLWDIEAVFGFPLLKFFLVVKKRWWNVDETRTNRYATLIPTRELHYRASPIPGSTKGLILVYTDRPASGFWSSYIQHKAPEQGQQGEPSAGTKPFVFGGVQSEPEQDVPGKNVHLINKALQYLKAYGVTLLPDDIEYYGIRDWGREPYIGAAHAWYPERQSWKILKRLSAFAPGDAYSDGVREKNVLHVCGEAYSDYQAFIEGALRSAEHVLHTCFPKAFTNTPTHWLCDDLQCTCHQASDKNDR